MNSQMALDNTRQQLASVTQQYSQARQHINDLEVSRCWRCIFLAARQVKLVYTRSATSEAQLETGIQ